MRSNQLQSECEREANKVTLEVQVALARLGHGRKLLGGAQPRILMVNFGRRVLHPSGRCLRLEVDMKSLPRGVNPDNIATQDTAQRLSDLIGRRVAVCMSGENGKAPEIYVLLDRHITGRVHQTA